MTDRAQAGIQLSGKVYEILTEAILWLRLRPGQALIERDCFEACGCQVLSCTEDGTFGRRALVTEVVEDLLQSESVHAAGNATAGRTLCVYGCGPEGMLEELRSVCSRHRLPCQLSYEAVIKCAFGVCGSCARHAVLICKDGPVLDWSEEGNLALAREAGPLRLPLGVRF